MAGMPFNYRRNYNSADTATFAGNALDPIKTIDEIGWSAPSGKVFKEWNKLSDGTGTSFSPGSYNDDGYDMYAIWQESVPVDYLTTDQELTSIANAIRTKGGTSASLVYPTGFVSAIEAISTGGVVVSDTTDSHGGTIRTITTTQTPVTLQSKTGITPGASAVTVTPDTGYNGMSSVQVNGDANLVAGNIKNGTTIFGVTGTYSGGGGGTTYTDYYFAGYAGGSSDESLLDYGLTISDLLPSLDHAVLYTCYGDAFNNCGVSYGDGDGSAGKLLFCNDNDDIATLFVDDDGYISSYDSTDLWELNIRIYSDA